MRTCEEYSLDISFPSLPTTISRVGEFIASGRTDPAPLVEIVEDDPSVSVNVLRRANSAYYGVRRTVESIDQAVRLLGFIEVCAITMIEGVDKMQQGFKTHPDLFQRAVREAVFTGRFAQRLSNDLRLPREWAGLSFLSGFIYTSGRLVLLHAVPDAYAALAKETGTPLPDADAEWRAFGASHRSLAPEAGEHWGLPERICAVLHAAAEPAAAPDDPLADPPATLALAIQAGSAAAGMNMAGEPFALPSGLDDLPVSADAPPVETMAMEAADDAAAYAAEVSRF